MNMQSAVDPKIIERITRLLALGQHGATNEHEASLAMERAQDLMSKHNLTMATIAAEGGKGETRTKDAMEGQAMYEYQQNLMKVICDINYCYVQIMWSIKSRAHSKGVGYKVIGTESNVASVKVMFDYLTTTINRLVMDELGGDYKKRMSRYAMSWCAGCSERLQYRLQKRHDDYLAEQKKEAEKKKQEQEVAARHPSAAPTSKALVVIMTDYAQEEKWLNEDFRMGKEPGTTKAEHLARDARQKARYAEALALGHNKEVADWYSLGYNMERAINLAKPPEPAKPLSEKERVKQERENERWHRRQEREYEKRLNKRDWTGYAKGKSAGDSISLDKQIGRNSDTRRIK